MADLNRIDLPPVWAAAAALTAWALSRAAPGWRIDLGPWPEGLLAAAGGGLLLWSAAWFRLRRTPIEPRKQPRVLIIEGPYRLNRNPIYTGMALMLLGWALWLGAPLSLAPAAAFPFVITRRFVLGEEAALRVAFGADAEDWLSRTRRW